MKIKQLDINNAAALADIERQCFAQPWSESVLHSHLCRDDHIFLGAFTVDRDTPIGYVGAYFAADQAYIMNIGVLPEYRRRGVAQLLLNQLTDCCKQRNAAFVSLELAVNNTAAAALYQKSGFTVQGTRRNFYSAPPGDAYIMTLFFGE